MSTSGVPSPREVSSRMSAPVERGLDPVGLAADAHAPAASPRAAASSKQPGGHLRVLHPADEVELGVDPAGAQLGERGDRRALPLVGRDRADHAQPQRAAESRSPGGGRRGRDRDPVGDPDARARAAGRAGSPRSRPRSGRRRAPSPCVQAHDERREPREGRVARVHEHRHTGEAGGEHRAPSRRSSRRPRGRCGGAGSGGPAPAPRCAVRAPALEPRHRVRRSTAAATAGRRRSPPCSAKRSRSGPGPTAITRSWVRARKRASSSAIREAPPRSPVCTVSSSRGRVHRASTPRPLVGAHVHEARCAPLPRLGTAPASRRRWPARSRRGTPNELVPASIPALPDASR